MSRPNSAVLQDDRKGDSMSNPANLSLLEALRRDLTSEERFIRRGDSAASLNAEIQLYESYLRDMLPIVERLTEELRTTREERDKLQLAIEISAKPIKYFVELKAERDALLADLAAEKRHWVEDDRDLNALVEERDALQKQLDSRSGWQESGCVS